MERILISPQIPRPKQSQAHPVVLESKGISASESAARSLVASRAKPNMQGKRLERYRAVYSFAIYSGHAAHGRWLTP